MATLNTAARNTAITAISATYNTALLVIYSGATVLVTHTLTGFGAAASGVVAANAIAGATVVASGNADSAKLIAGANEITLTVGTTGADVIMSTTSLVADGTSTINNITITMPAS